MRYNIILADEDGQETIINFAHDPKKAKQEFKKFVKATKQTGDKDDVILRNEYGQEVDHYYHM